MNRPDELISAIVEEDRLLLSRLEQCPDAFLEMRGSGGLLSFKDTLGHLAFWDSFAVRFFTRKLDSTVENDSPPLNFEQRNRQELQRVRQLSFTEVMKLYGKATRDLITFLNSRWHELSEKQRRDLFLPLKHRRHHRLLLEKTLGSQQDTDLLKEHEEEA